MKVCTVMNILTIIVVAIAVEDSDFDDRGANEFNLRSGSPDTADNHYQFYDELAADSALSAPVGQSPLEAATRNLKGELCRACEDCWGSVLGIGVYYCWIIFAKCLGLACN